MYLLQFVAAYEITILSDELWGMGWVLVTVLILQEPSHVPKYKVSGLKIWKLFVSFLRGSTGPPPPFISLGGKRLGAPLDRAIM